MASRGGMKIVVDKVAAIGKSIEALIGQKVGIGWPESSTTRKNDDGSAITNAALGYIHENGAPEAHIPGRHALRTGIDKVQGRLNRRLQRAAEAAFDGNKAGVDAGLSAAGMDAMSGVKNAITEGLPPPLADSTLRGRIAKRPGGRLGERRELIRREMGKEPGMDLAKPLLFSGQFKNSVNYVVRKSKEK